MRTTLCLLLGAACIVSLVGEALGDCVTSSWGKTGRSGYALPTLDVKLSPRTINTALRLPFVQLMGCKVVGVEVKFCEASSLVFLDDYTVRIHLDAPSWGTSGVLSSVIHCEPVIADTTEVPFERHTFHSVLPN